MECSYDLAKGPESPNASRKIITHPLCLPKSSPWFDLMVFYVSLSNCEVDMPEHLTLYHIPLTPDTILEVNGRKSSSASDCVFSLLRRERIDKKSEEVTFVSTDCIRMTGSVRFEVYDRDDDLLFSGVLESCDGNGCAGESKIQCKKWKMKCQPAVSAGDLSFLEGGKQYATMDLLLPTVEVYVAGCFLGTPIILTKTLHLCFRKQHQVKVMLDSIPEYETTDVKEEKRPGDRLKLSEYQTYKAEVDTEIEEEDGELSWFNAGVRVGVGIGLGICLGIGIGVGLLVRTYQGTTRNFKRRSMLI